MIVLPIDSAIPRFLEAFRRSRAVVVDAAPGAGKTTRVPRALLDTLPRGKKIFVLEPRRIAAKMAALRVASEMGEEPGQTVGYSMRFEENVGPETRLVFMTEGVLTRRLLKDPELSDAHAVVLDEVHERHLEGDLALALLLHLQRTSRPDLSIVAMSATIEADRFAELLGAQVVRSDGRMFDVSIEHEAKRDGRELSLRVVTAVRSLLVDRKVDGDLLVFLPGAAEIRSCIGALAPLASSHHLSVLPLHGSLSIEEQMRAIGPADRRKVVLSTNVAESSLTIDGVVAVVDSGLANVASSSPWTGLPMLRKAPISKASAAQRAGRAGRTRPGFCVRLYTRGDLEARPEHDAPEIARADLAFARLLLLAAGVRDLETLPWLDAPPPSNVAAAEKLLDWLGAIDEARKLTRIGRRMLEFPLHPRLSRIVVEACDLDIGGQGAALAAVLGERDLVAASFREDGRRAAPSQGRDGTSSDVLCALDAYQSAQGSSRSAWTERGFSPARIAAVRRAEKQIASIVRRVERRQTRASVSDLDEEDRLRLAILMGFPDRVGRLRRPPSGARRGEREILFAAGGSAELAAESGAHGVDLVVCVDAEERRDGRAARTLVRAVSAIESDWLLDRFVDRIDDRMEVVWNETAERAEVLRRLMFVGLALEESIARPEGQALVLASQELFRKARERGFRAFVGDSDVDRFLLRARFARVYCPDSGIGDIGDTEIEGVLQTLCEGKRSFAELMQADLASSIRGLLGPAGTRKLAEIAPEVIVLPGGRKAKVSYTESNPPFIESRLQDFFGMRKGPSAALGRVPIVLHLLAPNMRAVQVTTDLEGFWEKHYPGIARELRRKYPRHAWPEDPLTASPPQRR